VASTINIDAYSDALIVLGTAGIVVPIVRRWGLNRSSAIWVQGLFLVHLALGLSPNRFPFSIGSPSLMPKASRASPARKLITELAPQRAIDPELTIQPPAGEKHAIVVGYGRVGKVVCSLLNEHSIPYIAVDHDASGAARDRRAQTSPRGSLQKLFAGHFVRISCTDPSPHLAPALRSTSIVTSGYFVSCSGIWASDR
jgi:hypothetical protein